jgi:hypothetical protein
VTISHGLSSPALSQRKTEVWIAVPQTDALCSQASDLSLDDPYRASGCLLQQLPRDASEKEFFQS